MGETSGLSEDVSVLCSAAPPFRLLWASAAWLSVFGFTRDEILIRDLRCIEGKTINEAAAQAIIRAVCAQMPVGFTCVSYTKRGVAVKHRVQIVPITPADGSSTTIFRAISTVLDEPTWFSRLLASPERKRQRVGPPPRFGLASPALSEHARVITTAVPPYSVLWASPEWLQLCSFSAVQVLGQTLKCIQGPQTSREAISGLMGAVRSQQPVRGVTLVNYDADGRAFQHVVDVEPMIGSHSQVVAFMASSRQVHLQELAPLAAAESGLDVLASFAGGAGGLFECDVPLGAQESVHGAASEQGGEEVEIWDERVEELLHSWEKLSVHRAAHEGPRRQAAWA